MVKMFRPKKKASSETVPVRSTEKQDPHPYVFFVYVQWSQENRVIKTYMRTRKRKSETDMICSGLSDLMADPHMKLNQRNINMAILFQVEDDQDITKELDITGIVPTRLDHYLNSDPEKRIQFSQEEIEKIVNGTEFTYRALN